MKKALAILAILTITVLLIAALFLNNVFREDTETVYVGVTYCGDSVEEGKMLINKVKHYTNLFVLQSGSLQRDLKSVDELGDYAVSAGMYFLPYFGHYVEETFSVWLETAKQKWGTNLLGVYYSDEPGGKMLDDYVEFKNTTTGDSIMKTRYGDVVVEKSDGVYIIYKISGVIELSLPASHQNSNSTDGTETGVYAIFYPDGTITVDKPNANLPDYATYEELESLNPFKDVHKVADHFTARNQHNVGYLSNLTTVFTSDYALYWFDYLAGYDVILAHMGWNHTVAQEIALLRGAASLQNKDWGVVITWKYTHPPYLDTGMEILSQLSTAYECGAKYFVLFNYYEGDGSAYGTMKGEHFEALETFWNNVVKNSRVVHGSLKADSVLILPENYGCGMRRLEDRVWGIWEPDEQSQQIWYLTESILKDEGFKVDIVYEDSDFPLPPEYQRIYYWDQE